jgi:dTDP-4-dehydrorhamnose reductase
MRVLICGAAGQVGHELLVRAPDSFTLLGLDSQALDISDGQSVQRQVEAFQPQLIINAAAYTAVDKAESEPERAFAVNRDGAANLARAAERCGSVLLHISTDYVFDGQASQPYRETDICAPAGVYGASKLAGEQAIALHCQRHLILRTSWVFGAHGHNFVKTMLHLGAERGQLGVVADQIGGPTPAAAIADALWQLAQVCRQQPEQLWGIYHFAGQPACSWHAFAEEIFRQALELGLLAKAPQVNAIGTADYPTPARRPAWSVLDSSKLSSQFGIQPPDWKCGLRQILLSQAMSSGITPEPTP